VDWKEKKANYFVKTKGDPESKRWRGFGSSGLAALVEVEVKSMKEHTTTFKLQQEALGIVGARKKELEESSGFLLDASEVKRLATWEEVKAEFRGGEKIRPLWSLAGMKRELESRIQEEMDYYTQLAAEMSRFRS
jgi:hypothetical protein